MKKQPKLSSLIDKACFDYNLINNSDRILIGASGGKDSTLLVEYFAERSKRPDSNFSFKALFIKSDFSPDFPLQIKNIFDSLNVDFEQLDVNILERVKDNQKMSCYWCSTQRRTELLKYAVENGFNKIALGHHLDDVLETLIMNMTEKGELSTMIPSLVYQKYPVTIIRPLCYITEDKIISYAQEEGFDGFTCTCNYMENSFRKEARKKLEILTDSDPIKKERLFASLKNIQKEYLP